MASISVRKNEFKHSKMIVYIDHTPHTNSHSGCSSDSLDTSYLSFTTDDSETLFKLQRLQKRQTTPSASASNCFYLNKKILPIVI